jgi:hypothetical protein|tara:strand:- start:295 stop:672 length:378 start_codon:yes stop_codon:yes gene_type:complete
MDYSSSFPKTSNLDFSSAFDTDKAINFDAVGESIFPTENILGVNKNLDTIRRLGETVSSMGSSNLPSARPVGAEEAGVREKLSSMAKQLESLKREDLGIQTIEDKMKVAKDVIAQAVKDFKSPVS